MDQWMNVEAHVRCFRHDCQCAQIKTYTKNNKKNIWLIETTPPIKNPTAMELWNFLMIMVPPMLRIHSIVADQKDASPSANGREPITTNDMSISMTVRPKIEYLDSLFDEWENAFNTIDIGRRAGTSVIIIISKSKNVPPTRNQFAWWTPAEPVGQVCCIVW